MFCEWILNDGDVLCLKRKVEEERKKKRKKERKKERKKKKKDYKSHFTVLTILWITSLSSIELSDQNFF